MSEQLDQKLRDKMYAAVHESGNLAANEVLSSFIHSLNNYLFIVSGRMEICGNTLEEKEKTLDILKTQTEKLKETIKKYESMKKVCLPEKSSCDIASLIRSVVRIF